MPTTARNPLTPPGPDAATAVPATARAEAGSDAPAARRLVLVAGSGRSGTSTMGGILKLLGLYVPQPEVAADETNPRGFAEPQWLVDFHSELLATARVQVSDARPAAWFEAGRAESNEAARTAATLWLEEQFRQESEVVLKDPRLIWFFGLWNAAALRLGAEVSTVTMLRPPTEVVGSKRAYYGHRGEIDSLAGWVNLMVHTERATRGNRRAFVQYDDLLDDWTIPVARLGDAFDLAAIKSSSATMINDVHQFVDPDLRRVALGWDDLDVPGALKDLADEAWTLLCRVASSDDAEVHRDLDDLRKRYAAYYAEAEAVAHSSVVAVRKQVEHFRGRRDALREDRKELRRLVRELQQRIVELEGSRMATAYGRAKRRLPPSVKRSAKKVLGRADDASEHD